MTGTGKLSNPELGSYLPGGCGAWKNAALHRLRTPFPSHSYGNDVIAWTAEVLGEDIGIQLARIPGFLVVSRNSTERYRRREVGIGQSGRMRMPSAALDKRCYGVLQLLLQGTQSRILAPASGERRRGRVSVGLFAKLRKCVGRKVRRFF